MKTQPILGIALALLASLCALICNGQSYTVTGKIKTKDSLLILWGNGVTKPDSMITTSGEFKFTGNLQHPDVYTIALIKNNKVSKRNLFIEGGIIQIDATTFDSLPKARLRMGQHAAHDLYLTYYKRLNPLISLASAVRGMAAGQGLTEPEKKIYADMEERIYGQEDKVAEQFVLENTGNIVGAAIFNFHLLNRRISVAKMDSIYRLFDAGVYQTRFLTEVKAKIDALLDTTIGHMAPQFSQPDVNGKLVTLNTYKGKYVLLDFWASWCGPCRLENPGMIKILSPFNKSNLVVIGISLDENKDSWIKAIKDDHLPWLQLSDLKGWRNDASKKYAVGAIPGNCLIGPDGKIIARNLHGEQLTAMLNKLLILNP